VLPIRLAHKSNKRNEQATANFLFIVIMANSHILEFLWFVEFSQIYPKFA
jgi:hypothetical protein